MIATLKSSDLKEVVGLAKWFYLKMNPGALDEFNSDAFIATWSKLIDSGIGIVVKRQGNSGIAEAIGMILYPDPNTGKMAAGFGFWYIAAEDDSLANGFLHERMEDELRERGIKRIFFSNLLNDRYDKVEKFLLHAGYRPVEVHFRKDL
jgi:hypothetical protein